MAQNEPVYAICFRPEVAGDVISGENVDYRGLCCLNFEVASFSSFRHKKNFVTVAVDSDDSIKRKRIRVSLPAICKLPKLGTVD